MTTKSEHDRNRAFWALPTEERQKELVRRVNRAFGLQLENHHEAIGAMKAAVTGAMVPEDTDPNDLPDGMGCPNCGCRNVDLLEFRDEESEIVDCQKCETAFDAATGKAVRR